MLRRNGHEEETFCGPGGTVYGAVIAARCGVREDVDDDAADDDVTVEDTADDTAADDEDEDEPEVAGDDAAEAEEEAEDAGEPEEEAEAENVEDGEFFFEEEEFFFEEEELLEGEEEAGEPEEAEEPKEPEVKEKDDNDDDSTDVREVEIVVSTFMFDAPMFLMAVEDIPVTVNETSDAPGPDGDNANTLTGDGDTKVAEAAETIDAAGDGENDGTLEANGSKLVGAPIHDNKDNTNTEPEAWHGNALEDESTYRVTEDEDEEGDGFTALVLEANGIKRHENGEHNMGRWAGVGFVPKTQGVSGVRYSKVVGGADKPSGFGSSSSLEGPDRLDADVDWKGEEGKRNGIAFYVDLDDYYEGDYLWIAIQWGDEGDVEIYRVKIVSDYLQTKFVEEEEFVPPETPAEPETPETPETPEIPTVPEPAAPTDRDKGDKDTSGPASAASAAPAEAPAAPAAPEAAAPAPETTGETTKAEVAAAVTTDANGAAKAEVSGTSMNQAIEAAVTEAAKQGAKPVVEIEVQTAAEAKSLNVELPAASLKTLAAADNASLAINSGVAAVTLDHSALSALANAATGSTVTLEVAPVAAEALNEAQQAAVGGATVVDLALLSDGVAIEDYGEGTITVSLPYAPADGVDAADIVVYSLAEDGALTPCETSYEDGQVTFVTTHLGEYVIGSAK